MRARRVFLHLSEGPGNQESRVLKEASTAIAAGLCSEAVLLARPNAALPLKEHPVPGVTVLRVGRWTDRLPRAKPLALLRLWESRQSFARAGVALKPALVHCHSLGPLPASVRIGGVLGVPIVYDAHELVTERNGLSGPLQMLSRWIERTLIRTVDVVLVVNDSIADWYAEKYQIERPTVVRNIPVRPDGPPPERSPILRALLGIPDQHLIFLYAGALFPGRRIEQYLRVFSRVPTDRHIVFMGYGELQGMVRSSSAARGNIHFLPAVPPGEVLRFTAGADVGLVGVENACLSYFYSLPNKLFEYLLAGVPAACPNWPEMRRVVAADGCGWLIGETDDEWLTFVATLDSAEIQAKREGAQRARTQYSWQREEAALLQAYNKALQRHSSPPSLDQ